MKVDGRIDLLPEVFILGDSHITALSNAMQKRDATSPFLEGRPVVISRFEKFKREIGKALPGIPEEEVLARLSAAGEKTTFISLVGGNQSNAFGMMQHPTPFDFFEPSLPDATLDERATIIPVAVLEDMFRAFIAGRDGSQLQRVRAAFDGPMYHVVPPPPKEDNAFILEGAETYFRDRNIALIGVSPPLLRLKLWHLQVRITDAFCRENDIVMLQPPRNTTDGPGYLKRKFYGRDATHANAAYGDLVLKMIETDLFPVQEDAR